jgi:hypothetical protein
MSANLRHVEVVCSFEWHNWQWLSVLVEKVVLGPTLPSVPFPKKKDITEYEGKTKDDPQETLLNLED